MLMVYTHDWWTLMLHGANAMHGGAAGIKTIEERRR